jgi:2-polyprenyl-3-methyl-5-hydroxy-6-metoxy-1,4-benzoquinol methylase
MKNSYVETKLDLNGKPHLSIVCELCGSASFKDVFHVPDATFSSNIKTFDIIQCTHCGLSVMNPFPTQEDIEEIYVKDNVFSTDLPNPYQNHILFNFLNPLFSKYGNSRRYAARKSLKLLKKKENISILDIGCSTGSMLNEFLSKKPQTDLTGIDIDPNAKENGMPHLKDHIIIDDFLTHQFTKKYDIISMSFVLEHILDFDQYVQKVIQLLNPYGILYISVPDIDSPRACQQRDHWKLVNDRRSKIGHIRWFNKNSMTYFAQRYCLTLRHCNNIGELFYHFSPKTQQRLKKFLGTDHTGERIIRYYPLRIIYALLIDAWFSQIFSYGDCLCGFYEKES